MKTNTDNKLKVAICAIACQENDYIREWVEYYKNLGIANIFLYDNNKSWEANEDFHDVINDYIESEFVHIIDKRDVVKVTFQTECYNEFYQLYGDQYDWICFFDCDEFLTFRKFDNIHGFLSQDKFNKFHIIKINWESYNDNGHVYKTEGKVQDRFPIPSDKTKEEIAWENRLLKSIVRGHLDISKMHIGIHTPIPKYINEQGIEQGLLVDISDPDYSSKKTQLEKEYKWDYRVCFADGEESFDICYPNCFSPSEPRYDDAVIKHYRTKSCQEYFETKARRGFQDCSKSILNIGTYFYFNEYAPEKMKYFLEKGAEHPICLLDNTYKELVSAGDFMFNYANAMMAIKDIEYPFDMYWRYNEFHHLFELFKNTQILKSVNIFPQTILNDIKYSKNCTEYHYDLQASTHKYAPDKINIKLGRNIAVSGQYFTPKWFDKDYVISLFKDENIENEIKSIYSDINFTQTCALYVNSHTLSDDIYRLFEIYTSNVKYIIVYDNYEEAANIVYNALSRFTNTHVGINLEVSWLYAISNKYSYEILKLYFISMCRVNFINFYSTTAWWGAYLNTNELADIIIPYNENEIVSLMTPTNDIRYKNLYTITV